MLSFSVTRTLRYWFTRSVSFKEEQVGDGKKRTPSSDPPRARLYEVSLWGKRLVYDSRHWFSAF